MPEPNSCRGLRPVTRRAAVVTTSTGFVTIMYVASGATSKSWGSRVRVNAMVVPARSIRLCPGFCFAPAVTTTMRAPRTISMSSLATISPRRMKDKPCEMSSSSASSLVVSMS